MTQEILRTFLAFPISDTLREKIAALQEELMPLKLDAKWVKPKGIHLTLKFLGDTPIASLEAIQKNVEEIVKRHRSFSISVDTVGAFPNPRAPRVLWVGAKEDSKEAEALTEELDQGLQAFGYEIEKRKFKPHLTLAWLRSLKNSRKFSEFLEEYTLLWQETLPCQTLVHYKSTLTPKGAIYETLYQVSLM